LREYERLQQGVCDDNDGCPLSLWDRFGLFMRVNQPGVSLTLFGAGEDMKIRLRELLGHERWEEVLADPYVLLDVILDELYLQMDRNVQDVSRLFGNIESVSWG
jgi:hypothetical protein